MTWHASTEDLRQFAASPELLEAVTAFSIEHHLVACAACREQVAHGSRAVDPQPFDALGSGIVERFYAPRPPLVERLLRRLSVAEANARLVSATRSLQVSWLVALLALIAGLVVLV